MRRLGDILVAHGAVARDELEQFLTRHRGIIGRSLRAHTLIRSRALAMALAEQHGLAFIELGTTPVDAGLFRPSELGHYLQHQYWPHRQCDGTLLIATPEPSPMLRSMLADYYRQPVELVVVSTRDFSTVIANTGATSLTRRARIGLRRRYRHLAADRVLIKPQITGFIIMGMVLLATLVVVPETGWRVLLIGCNLFYFVTLAFKVQMFQQGGIEAVAIQRNLALLDHDITQMDDAILPAYSILIPVYKESAGVIARLIGHLEALDYPKEKLDIKLICEADDHGTIAAIKSCQPPETMEILRVAPSQPRTKPKACNVALQQIRGEYVVIFDAEDAPEPLQLKRAVALFRREPCGVACVQAALNYYNRDENLLTQLFAIEYSSLFHILLPAMQRMQLPIPLGGTSNHLRVDALKHTGGWDAFNVTEDADLGIRLAYFGYQTRILPSLTLEEAPITVRGWLKQRTRWVKGYIQTWLVFMRHPAELKRRLGPRGYYGFQFFVGAPALTFLFSPLLWAVFIIGGMGLMDTHLPAAMIGLCGVSFVGGMASHWVFARAVIRRENWPNMTLALAVFPFYWLLHSLAAARALWQLAVAPHYWDKTTHGVSRLFPAKRS